MFRIYRNQYVDFIDWFLYDRNIGLNWVKVLQDISEAYSEPCQISKMEFVTKIVNGLKQKSLQKNLIFDDWLGTDYASAF